MIRQKFIAQSVLVLALVLVCNSALSLSAQTEGIPALSAVTTAADAAPEGANAGIPRAQEIPLEASKESAFKIGFAYRGEAFTNVRGGFASHRAALLGSVEASVDLDLTKLGIGRGEVHVSAQNVHGRGINDLAVGAVQSASNLDSARFSRLIEAWYGDSYLHDKLRIKFGRQYGDAEFQGVENAADFLNSSYGLIPTIQIPTYPSPELGASIWTSPTKWISFGTGIYRGQLLDPLNETGSPIRKGLFTIAETKIEPIASTSSKALVVRTGVWHQNDGAWLTSVDTNSSRTVRNYGVYASADYWFQKQSDENRGPGIFMQWGWAPSDRNEIHQYWGGGISLPAMIKSRPQDTVGLGITQARLSCGNAETAIETFYKFRATKRMTLQPDLQWTRRPSGTGHNALVAGLRVGLEF